MTARIARATSRLVAVLARLVGRRGRVCTRCRRWRSASAFRPDPKLRNGLTSWCRRCMVDRGREWRLAHPIYFELYNVGRRVEHAPRPCPGCGETLASRRVDAIYCSERCQHRAERQRSAARVRATIRAPRPCSECREAFAPSRRSQLFCSPRCARKADKRRAAARRRGAASS